MPGLLQLPLVQSAPTEHGENAAPELQLPKVAPVVCTHFHDDGQCVASLQAPGMQKRPLFGTTPSLQSAPMVPVGHFPFSPHAGNEKHAAAFGPVSSSSRQSARFAQPSLKSGLGVQAALLAVDFVLHRPSRHS